MGQSFSISYRALASFAIFSIADAEATGSQSSIQSMMLESMKREVAEFEAANPTEAAAMKQRAKELAGG